MSGGSCKRRCTGPSARKSTSVVTAFFLYFSVCVSFTGRKVAGSHDDTAFASIFHIVLASPVVLAEKSSTHRPSGDSVLLTSASAAVIPLHPNA